MSSFLAKTNQSQSAFFFGTEEVKLTDHFSDKYSVTCFKEELGSRLDLLQQLESILPVFHILHSEYVSTIY